MTYILQEIFFKHTLDRISDSNYCLHFNTRSQESATSKIIIKVNPTENMKIPTLAEFPTDIFGTNSSTTT